MQIGNEHRKVLIRYSAMLSTLVVSVVIAAATPATTLVVRPAIFLEESDAIPPMNAVVGDVNGDENLDIVAGYNFAAPVVYLNNGTSEPFAGVPGDMVGAGDTQQQAQLADLNGDRHLDIVSVGFNAPTKLYFNNGTADPFAGVTGDDIGPGSTDSSSAVAIADVNGDGLPDIGVANTNHYPSRVYLHNGTAHPFDGVTPLDIGSEAAYATGIVFADVDASGRPDAILSFELNIIGEPGGILIYFNNGTSDPFGGVTPLKIEQGKSAYGVVAADFNGDAALDLLFPTYTTEADYRLYLNTGSPSQPYDTPASLVRNPDVQTGCLGVAAADVNNDDLTDAIFTCGTNTGVPGAAYGAVYINQGTSDPFAGVTPSVVPSPLTFDFSRSAAVADVDGDGAVELVVSGGFPTRYHPLTIDQNPVAVGDTVAITKGDSLDWDVLANDTDADGVLDRSSLTIVDPPLHGISRINPASNTIIYQPDDGFSGSDSLKYSVRDDLGVLSDTATLAITVQSPPVASNDAATTFSDRSVTLDVIANDSSAGGSLVRSSLTIITAPAHGAVAINDGDQSVTFTPATAYVGADTFQYTVVDNLGATSNVATVTVTVTAPPDPPSGGGGGATNWLSVLALGMLAAAVRRPKPLGQPAGYIAELRRKSVAAGDMCTNG
jgi:Bacterial Ig domain/FG-GAP-like repeat